MPWPWGAEDMGDEKDRIAVLESQIVTLVKECDALKSAIHDLIPKVASLSVYAEKIPAFSERFERIFKLMGDIQVSTAIDRTRLYMVCGLINVVCSAVVVLLVSRIAR